MVLALFCFSLFHCFRVSPTRKIPLNGSKGIFLLLEVKQMMQTIEYEELDDVDDVPSSAGLKVERHSDPWLGYDEDERDEAQEFIAWYLSSEHAVLLLIPAKARSGFWPDLFGDSAFNTHDFEEMVGRFRFDRREYREQKLLEQVEDFAVMHSCISSSDDRENVRERCRDLVESEFVSELVRHLRLAELAGDAESWLHHRMEVRRYVGLVERAGGAWRKHNPPHD